MLKLTRFIFKKLTSSCQVPEKEQSDGGGNPFPTSHLQNKKIAIWYFLFIVV